MSDIILTMTSPKSSARTKRTITAKQIANLRPFVKGDPRINRKGTPVRSMAQLKKAIQNFLNEPTFDNKTMLDSVLIAMMKTKGDKILEFGFGKVPQPIEADISVQHSWKEFIAQQNAPELPAPADIEAEATLIDALADNDE